GQERLHEVDLSRDGTVEQSQIDGVTVPRLTARVQAGEHRHRRIEAGEHVRDRDPHLVWWSFNGTRDAHEAAQSLNGKVVSRQIPHRPGAAKARDGADDQGGVARVQLLGADAKLVRARGAEVLQENVAALDEPVENLQPLPLSEIQGDGALVPVA